MFGHDDLRQKHRKNGGLACQSRRPSVLVADPGCLGLELRMSEDELGADIDRLEIDLNAREIAGLIGSPPVIHCQRITRRLACTTSRYGNARIAVEIEVAAIPARSKDRVGEGGGSRREQEWQEPRSEQSAQKH